MIPETNRFRDEYTTSLREYLADPGEEGLEKAYELGRRAVREQVSVLELSAIHHDVLTTLVQPSANRRMAELAKAVTEFFSESLSAFEMVQRGFGEVQKIALLEKQYADQMRLLAEGSTAINATFSFEEMAQRLAELAVRLTDGDLGMVVITASGDWSHAILVAVHPHNAVTLPTIEELGNLDARARAVETRDVVEPLINDKELVAALAWPERSRGLVIVRSRRGSFSDRDESALRQLTQTSSAAIERSELYKRQSTIAETLQRALLPDRLPTVANLEMATRYIPGEGGANVGGDWFDVLELGEGRVGLAIGDVAGHGVHAASEMGQVRTAFRAYAMEHRDPAQVMSRMASLLHSQNPGHFSTIAYLVLATDRRTMQLAKAGHLPPLVISASGTSRYLHEGLSPPLGVVPKVGYKQVTIPVYRGDTIVLFTDGVLGKRPTDEVLAEVQSVLVGPTVDLDALCDRVLATMRGSSHDDVALLAARLT